MVATDAADPADAPSVSFLQELGSLVDRLGDDVGVIAIDMPIGLSADGQRPADDLARSLLGSRRATFFPTPVRAVLDHDDFDAANQASRAASGRGLSIQSWNLVPKIREVDALHAPQHHEVFLEAHPECSFAQMNGAPVMTKKATAEGRAERLNLLTDHLTPAATEIVQTSGSRLDAIDSLALLWTARRVMTGDSVRLGDPSDVDPAGRPMWLTI